MCYFLFFLADSNPSYNFYKDSNISEILNCAIVLEQLEKRCIIELEQWPDHAILLDVSSFFFCNLSVKKSKNFSLDYSYYIKNSIITCYIIISSV